MRNRVTSPLLILALLSCPLWCTWASAHGIDCCGNCTETVESLEITECSETVCECCREQRPSSPQPSEHSHSDNCQCQGICGGAVIDSAIDFDLPQLPALDFCIDLASLKAGNEVSLSQLCTLQSSPPIPTQGTLRALHILILC